MTINRSIIGAFAAAIFVLGAGYIVYSGRPVIKLQKQAEQQVTQPITPPSTEMAAITASTVTTTTATQETAKEAASPVAPTGTEIAVTTPITPETPVKKPGIYTMADVQAHATPADCWAAINGSVYDLSTWIGRHPGGPGPIQGLCGTDGSAKFSRKHGSSTRPQSALALLKIGTLE